MSGQPMLFDRCWSIGSMTVFLGSASAYERCGPAVIGHSLGSQKGLCVIKASVCCQLTNIRQLNAVSSSRQDPVHRTNRALVIIAVANKASPRTTQPYLSIRGKASKCLSNPCFLPECESFSTKILTKALTFRLSEMQLA